MKNGWPIKKLGEVCTFQRGLTYAKTDEVDSSDTVVLRATNINLNTNLLDFSELRYIRDKVDVPETKRVRKGSLLVCTASGSKSHLGKIAFIDDDYGYAFGGFMGMLTPSSEIDARYLFHLMTSGDYKDYIDSLADGANINNLKFDQLSRFHVPLPPLAEQRRIVGILDEAFAAIVTAKANAEKNLQNAREVFESRARAFFEKSSAHSKRISLEEVCSLFVDSAHRTPEYQAQGIPALRPRDVVDGKLSLETAAKVSMPEYEIQSKRHKPRGGDIVYSRELSLGWAALLPESPRVCLSQGMCLFRPSNVVDPVFLLHVLNGPIGRRQALKAAVGAAHPHINLGDIKRYQIPVPPRDVQDRFVMEMDALETGITRVESLYHQKLTALDALKKSLLHEAFSGELVREMPAATIEPILSRDSRGKMG